MREALGTALALFSDPTRLGLMLVGVLAGLVVGILPGMGGIVAIAVLLPFVTRLEPFAALAMLTGSLAVVHTSDTITSVLIGAPGSAAAVPTMLEGHPMAKRGQAARALGAAYLSSLIGGLIGALGLTFSIPIARPLVLSFGSRELFMLTALGVSFAGSLVGREPLRGIISGLLGLLLGTVGPAPAAAEYRFTFGQLYLRDGLNLVVVSLGIFGIAEIISLLARGGAVAAHVDLGQGWLQGLRDVIEHRWLVLRGSLIGMWAGILPAIGATAGTWMAYGQVIASSRDRERFGKGDVRGIISPEAANNAVEAGDLIPTLLFSVPGSVPAAMIMGALLRYGVLPGPRIVSEHLNLIYVIVWTFAAANIVGAAIMFLASPLLARLTYVPFNRVAPAVVLAILLGAWQETQQWGDLVILLLFGLAGYAMKVSGWPRAPLLIGFVLAGPMERYFWLATSLYPRPLDWVVRPAVPVIGALLIAPFVWTAVRSLRDRRIGGKATIGARWSFGLDTVATVTYMAMFSSAWWVARRFLPGASLMPVAVAVPGTVLCGVQLVQELRGRSVPIAEDEEQELEVTPSPAPVRRRALLYLASIAVYYGLLWMFGFRVSSAIWLFGFLLLISRVPWFSAVVYAAAAVTGLEVLGRFLGVYLPPGYLSLMR